MKGFFMKNCLKLRFLWICLMVFVFSFSVSTASVEARSQITGWRTVKNYRYYYVNGKKVTGWKKIKGKEYYFNRHGCLLKNRIAGNTAGGYDFVDKNGQRVKDPAMRMAVALVRKITRYSMSREQKLETCYQYLVNAFDYSSYDYSLSPDTLPELARRMFASGYGDCIQSGAAMVYIAHVLGFPAKVSYGFVNSYSPDPIWEHGWAEVAFGSRYYVYDITMQRKYTGYLLHGVTLNQYPFAIKRSGSYRLVTSGGKAIWK